MLSHLLTTPVGRFRRVVWGISRPPLVKSLNRPLRQRDRGRTPTTSPGCVSLNRKNGDELNWLVVGVQRSDDDHCFQARQFDCLLGIWVIFERGNAAAGMNIRADVNQ